MVLAGVIINIYKYINHYRSRATNGRGSSGKDLVDRCNGGGANVGILVDVIVAGILTIAMKEILIKMNTS